jgi:hypothetical protein
MQSFAHVGGQLVNLVAAKNLDSLSRGVENNLAVPAFLEVSFDLGARIRGNRLVDHVVENCKKLGAGHFFNPVFPAPAPARFCF